MALLTQRQPSNCTGLVSEYNLTSLCLLGKYAVTLLEDYKRQLKAGKDPQYQSSTIPEISDETECW
ncbi:MAG: hypothetical protein MR809_09280 [Rikenellaceae bacterium]|nr:hypothetical protein [Rikenellaceae bacterium]